MQMLQFLTTSQLVNDFWFCLFFIWSLVLLVTFVVASNTLQTTMISNLVPNLANNNDKC